MMSNVPIGVIERILVHDRADQVLMLAKANGWSCTRAILALQAAIKGTPVVAIDKCRGSFDGLKPETARTAIQFYRLREGAASIKALAR